ncbi:MAG: sigma-54 dependent transcriptional regulator, partial [Spirochaetia bacterium]|jgi:two-component system response regulator HydG|nr:sigma-54 dependent transcriptional regulator [Spirochaetia bacterium]
MDVMDGIELTKKIRETDESIPVIIMTAYGSISSAVDAIKSGGYDYITKPIDYDLLKIKINRAVSEKKIRKENAELKEKLKEEWGLDSIIGKDVSMIKMFTLIKTVAPVDSSVLIEGECGTGKELVARSIYANSRRKDAPFVVVDCSSLPAGLLESELFGFEKGAFTGAAARKKGRIELADTGTLFLDEIGEMSLELQAKLLRVLQEKQIQRIGGLESVNVDFRLITATNRDIKKEVLEKRFRSDLYYRLNVINITVPPLRSRKGDIPLLAMSFIKSVSEKNGIPPKKISASLMDKLISLNWPGNVRELENCIERLMVISQGEELDEELLSDELKNTSHLNRTEAQSYNLSDIEKNVLIEALEKSDWNKSKAAKLLSIDRKALYNRLNKHNISVPKKTQS